MLSQTLKCVSMRRMEHACPEGRFASAAMSSYGRGYIRFLYLLVLVC